MIKYIGSKRRLVPTITAAVQALPETRRVIDLFSGSARVGQALKAAGYQVLSNDHNAYAATLARGLVQADAETHAAEAQAQLDRLAALPPRPGWFTETFCERSRFFQPHNGARIDAIREGIAALALEPEREAVLLTALMLAADKVDSTTGVQMAYLKQWAPRAHKTLELKLPPLLPQAAGGKAQATELDAAAAARQLSGDLAYLDPPYNQHKYLGNYHAWESLVRWDQPEVFGVACKRVDCKDRRSAFNSKPGIHAALLDVVEQIDARCLLVSFSDEGFIHLDQMLQLLSGRGRVRVLSQDTPRYVGARIGIFSPGGEKVGAVGHLRNTERLFLVTPRDHVLLENGLHWHDPGDSGLR